MNEFIESFITSLTKPCDFFYVKDKLLHTILRFCYIHGKPLDQLTVYVIRSVNAGNNALFNHNFFVLV